MNNLPKNTPKSIYLDLGYKPAPGEDFNDLTDVTWSESNATGNGVKYIRGDVVESQTIRAIIAFAGWYDRQQNSPELQNEKWMNETNAKSFLKEFNSRKYEKKM